MKRIALPVLILLALAAIEACGASQRELDLKRISFAQDILPMFEKHCVVCHGDSGGVSLASHDDIMSPKRPEPIVVPGDPDHSPLVQVIKDAKMPAVMPGVHDPLGGSPLTDRQLQILQNWVRQGAKNN